MATISFTPTHAGLYGDTLHVWATTLASNTDDPRHHVIPLVGEGGPIPAPVQDLAIEILPNDSAVLTWSPVTTTIHGNPVTPDMYLVFGNEQDPLDEGGWHYLFPVIQPPFVHPLVTRFRNQMSYQVIAWKGQDPALLGLVEGDPIGKLHGLKASARQ